MCGTRGTSIASVPGGGVVCMTPVAGGHGPLQTSTATTGIVGGKECPALDGSTWKIICV